MRFVSESKLTFLIPLYHSIINCKSSLLHPIRTEAASSAYAMIASHTLAMQCSTVLAVIAILLYLSISDIRSSDVSPPVADFDLVGLRVDPVGSSSAGATRRASPSPPVDVNLSVSRTRSAAFQHILSHIHSFASAALCSQSQLPAKSSKYCSTLLGHGPRLSLIHI